MIFFDKRNQILMYHMEKIALTDSKLFEYKLSVKQSNVSLASSHRPSVDVTERRLPSAKPVSVQGPSEGEEECGGERN